MALLVETIASVVTETVASETIRQSIIVAVAAHNIVLASVIALYILFHHMVYILLPNGLAR